MHPVLYLDLCQKTIVRLLEFKRIVFKRTVNNVGKLDVVRFTWKVIDNLERIGDADFDCALRRGCEEAVVPSAAIAEALSAARERKTGDDPCIDVLRLHDVGVNRFADAHRPAPQVLLVQSLQLRELVSLAVPARRDNLDARVKHVLDVWVDVDFVGRGEIDSKRRAVVKRVDLLADASPRLELFADDGVCRCLRVRRESLPPRFHLAPKLGLVTHGVE